MKGIDKNACRLCLEPVRPPDPNCGLFLFPKLEYVIRTDVKMIGHRRLLVLCLYARGDTPGGRPVLTYTMFQASDTFITYDHRPDTKTVWRTAALWNLERLYSFPTESCAFYSKPEEDQAIKFCGRFLNDLNWANGFNALNALQTKIRERECRQRQRKRELNIRERLHDLRPLPSDVESWLARKVVPAYFFYDYQKGKKVRKGICTACGQEVEMTDVRHNGEGVCPNCGRKLKMKSNGKRGYIWDRSTASVVQKFHEDQLVVRVLKAYSSWRQTGQHELNWYEEIRIIISPQENGKGGQEAYWNSNRTVGVTPWKKGFPPTAYLYGQNYEAETCGALYLRTLDKELAGTLWQYCQLKKFYESFNFEDLEVAPYLEAYLKHPRLEHLVKVGFYQLASDLVYRAYGDNALDESQNRTHQILRVMAEDVPFLRDLNVKIIELRKFQEYCAKNLKDRQKLFMWQMENHVEFNIPQILEHTTPHKMMRFLDEQYPLMRKKKTDHGGTRYADMKDVVSEYRDYLDMCVKEHYDMTNSFVLFPKDLQKAHDKVARRIKQRADAKMHQDFRRDCRRIVSQLDFELDGMKIIYPTKASDIIAEGHALHHCVGSYVERVAEQKCIILFLRKCDDETTPFYTIEVRGQEVVQVRGMQNAAATPEVQKFISQWEQKVLKRSLPQAA